MERRSSSASIPTDSRTALTSDSDGEVLPPMVRRRYAARCFILLAGRMVSAWRRSSEAMRKLTFGCCFWGTRVSIDLTAI